MPMGSVGDFKRQLKKNPTRCEVADDPVVVSKSRPMKPGNRVEEKTATTSGLVQAGGRSPKAPTVAKGRSFEEVFPGGEFDTRAAQAKVIPSGRWPSGTR
jgi:hypothetical protein